MARLAEDIGLDSVWVGDHYLYRHADGARGPWEAWTQLAAIAAVYPAFRAARLAPRAGLVHLDAARAAAKAGDHEAAATHEEQARELLGASYGDLAGRLNDL